MPLIPAAGSHRYDFLPKESQLFEGWLGAPSLTPRVSWSRVGHSLTRRVSWSFATLQEDGLDERVVLMTFSEFGRRVQENDGRDTDHGAAGPMLLVGPSVRGGLHGEYPSLTDLDAGDLTPSVDFRGVYATVLENWLGLALQQAVGGEFDAPPLFSS